MKTKKKRTVFVVVTDWDGPGYKNPGDADGFTLEGISETKAGADRIARGATKEYEGLGHEKWNGENAESWAFDVHVREQDVAP